MGLNHNTRTKKRALLADLLTKIGVEPSKEALTALEHGARGLDTSPYEKWLSEQIPQTIEDVRQTIFSMCSIWVYAEDDPEAESNHSPLKRIFPCAVSQ